MIITNNFKCGAIRGIAAATAGVGFVNHGFTPVIPIEIRQANQEIAMLHADGAASFDWPAIEAAAAKWAPGSTNAICAWALLLLRARQAG